MRKVLTISLATLLLGTIAFAAATVPAFPKTLNNARYVYVTSYDGDEYNPHILPQDRQAIATVQDAIQKWGHYILVFRPEEADMILMVQSRPTEDVLAVYDAREWPGQTWLWRAMGSGGLQKGETPLFTQLEKAVQDAAK
jgi:hypothetical protein